MFALKQLCEGIALSLLKKMCASIQYSRYCAKMILNAFLLVCCSALLTLFFFLPMQAFCFELQILLPAMSHVYLRSSSRRPQGSPFPRFLRSHFPLHVRLIL